MSEPVEAALHAAGIEPKLKAALEFGPIIGFVAEYLIVREQSYTLEGRDWDGFTQLVGIFIPVVLTTSLIMWRNVAADGAYQPDAGDDHDHHDPFGRADCEVQRRVLLQDVHDGGVPDALGGPLGGPRTRAGLAIGFDGRHGRSVVQGLNLPDPPFRRCAGGAGSRERGSLVQLLDGCLGHYDTFVMPASFFGYLALTICATRVRDYGRSG
ncbi:hypothetical protein [Thermoleptolyngbya sp.]|jgi:hypothetical protein